MDEQIPGSSHVHTQMTQTIVSLDLETTGLDPTKDAIIEIGAVKFRGDSLQDEYSTLINPGRPIPPFVTHLTKITSAMVADAPTLSSQLATIVEFIGDAPILGHNVRFDIGFFRQQQALTINPLLDTFDLASVLLPSAGRYSLGSLVAELGIDLPASHRALDDARATWAVYCALLERALELPLDTLAEIVRLGKDLQWSGDQVFEYALQQRQKENLVASDGITVLDASTRIFTNTSTEKDAKQITEAPTLQATDYPNPLDLAQLEALFESGESLSQHFVLYENRPEQVEMMRSVAKAISNQQHLLVEAGTGTGKSLAYLIPAIQWAWQNGLRVVISTNTINLQDQLVRKDIPTLQAALGVPFQVALLKGRSNYVCPRRLESMRRRGPRAIEEMRVLAKLLVWLPQSETGDRTEITLSGARDYAVWERLSAKDEGCTTERCASQMGGTCPFYLARRAAESAHLIVVNHALLLADVASENRVLPEYRYLIIDEAHHLEEATTKGLSFTSQQAEFERRLKDLGSQDSGLMGQVLSRCAQAIPSEKYTLLERDIGHAHNAISTCILHSDNFFNMAQLFAEAAEYQSSNKYDRRVRIVPTARASPEWEAVETAWENLNNALSPVIQVLVRLSKELMEFEMFDIDNREDMATSLRAAAHHQNDFVNKMDELVSQPNANQIYWIELSRDGKRLSLHIAPRDVGELVEKHLWHAKDAVVMTSATLTTGGEFNYTLGRLRAQDADVLAVGSPFDYQTATLVYLPSDIPEPSDRSGHQVALEHGLVQLCSATKGRTLVLFTSHAQLRETANAIRPPLERDGVLVYDQSSSASRHQLLESFRTAGSAVLLGARSFWEGVDVPGEALSVLVIVRLPFDVPSEPIIAARSETFEKPFIDYSVPEAVLRFRQGFGRLIRTRSDRGVVVVFDRRVRSKQYGREFLGSLPSCTVKDGPLALLPETAVRWIDNREEYLR